MLEYYIPYTLGRKTFFFYFVYYAWWMSVLGCIFLYLCGSLFLHGNIYNIFQYMSGVFPTLTFAENMLLQLTGVLGLSFILLGFLRAWLMYSQYKFYVDKDAFHYREGIFRTKEIRIPYFQISNVEIEKPYHFRLVGLSRVDIIMSSSGRPFESKDSTRTHLMPMIDSHRAKSLAKHIINHSSGTPGRKNIQAQYNDSEEEDYEDEE